jgi:hypothetical protein
MRLVRGSRCSNRAQWTGCQSASAPGRAIVADLRADRQPGIGAVAVHPRAGAEVTLEAAVEAVAAILQAEGQSARSCDAVALPLSAPAS